MDQILRAVIGYPSEQDGAISHARDYSLCPQENIPGSHAINILLTKLVWSIWLDTDLVLFWR